MHIDAKPHRLIITELKNSVLFKVPSCLVQSDKNTRNNWDSIVSTSISLANEVYSAKVYPNPFDSWQIIDVNSDNTISEFSIELYNINGMLMKKIYQGILSKERYKFSVDNSDLSSGIYIYLLQGKGYNKQFLKTVKF